MSLKSTCTLWFLAATLAFLVAPTMSQGQSGHPANDAATNARLLNTYGKLPLSFEANQGQADGRVRFLSRGPGYELLLDASQATLVLPVSSRKHLHAGDGSAGVRLRLIGSNTDVVATGVNELPGKTNYFIGNDPKKWRTNVPSYEKVNFHSVYPGIDLAYYGNQSGHLEYDFIVAPGTDPKAISLSIDAGADARFAKTRGLARLDPHGDILLHTEDGDIRFQKPIVYQEDGKGHRRFVDGKYVFSTNGEVSTISFAMAAYDHSKALIIDPAIVYSTYLGGLSNQGNGSGWSVGRGIAAFTDPTGHTYVYVAGGTCTSDFPTVNPNQSAYDGGCNGWGVGDVFVTKFDPAASGHASVIYSTYLGGSGPDGGNGIAVDSAGNAYVTGITGSTNFPLTNEYQSNLKSVAKLCVGTGLNPQNAFLSKLSSDGSTLMYSTYFGGSSCDSANTIALDSAGRAYIAGSTLSPDFPTVNPFQSSLQSPSGNAFVAVFDSTQSGAASLLYSTYLGGSSNPTGAGSPGDAVLGVAVDSAGGIHLGGYTNSANFPVINGFQMTSPSCGSGGDGTAFYTKLTSSAVGASQLLYSTYMGACGDVFNGVTVDSSGNAYLTGATVSGAFPLTTSLGSIPNGSSGLGQAFAAKINASLAGSASLVYSTIVAPADRTPGTFSDGGTGIAVEANGNAFIVGAADPGIPLVNPAQASANGVMQSINGGQTWTGPGLGLTEFPISALAVDSSTSPRTLYAASNSNTAAILVSTDGGLNWTSVFQLPGSATVFALAVDPTSPSNIYAGTSLGVYKSTDRGSTWNPFNSGLALSGTGTQGVTAFLFDGDTLYAGVDTGLFMLSPGAASWTATSLTNSVNSIAVDATTNPHTFYTGSNNGSVNGQKSTDGGQTWTDIIIPEGIASTFGVDTTTSPKTLYAYSLLAAQSDDPALFASSDGGNTWVTLNLPSPYMSGNDLAATIAVDTTTLPSTVYVRDISNGIFKSTDDGSTWSYVLPAGMGSIALDPTTATASTPATIYAGTSSPVGNAFVMELNPSGSTVLFSTYLGGVSSSTGANAIALDNSDNIYVTGATVTPTAVPYFPEVNAFQTVPPTVAAFFTMFGSQPLPASSSGSVTTQVGVQTGTLAITLPNISGSTTGTQPTLTVTPLSSTTTANFSLSDNLGAYDISTTASYSGSITICIQALTVNDPTTFNNLQLFHIVNGTSVNVASSWDFSTRTVCGTVTSLSPFILFSPTTSTALAGSLTPSAYGQAVTFTATVSASGGAPTGTITFYDGSSAVGTATLNSSGQGSFSTAALSAGTHTITAVYGGDSRLLGSTSAGFAQVVNKTSTSTVMNTSVNTSILNQAVTLAAGVSAVAPGSGTPGGSVTFYDGSTAIGTAALNANAQAMISISSLTVGSHSLTAVYGGDSNFDGSTSTPFAQQVDYEPAGTTCLGAAGHQILQPINADGSSVWKGGSTVPAKFRVCDANGVSVGTAGVVSKFSLTQVIAGTVTSVDETVVSSTPDTAFRWDSTNQQWIFNISTSGLTTGDTYVYTIVLNDGTTIGFQFGLR